MVRSEGSSYDYISDEGNVGSASAVSGHKFHSRVVSSADEDLRTVRQLCVARVPPALHQRDIGLYPVAIAISWTRRESSNLRADVHVTNHARSRILDKVHTWKKIVDGEFDLENFVVGGLKLNEDVTESIDRERERERERELIIVTLEYPSLSPPVCTSVPSSLNCPEEHQVSVWTKRGLIRFVRRSRTAECAVQSCCKLCMTWERKICKDFAS
jgi:hypothetical protein